MFSKKEAREAKAAKFQRFVLIIERKRAPRSPDDPRTRKYGHVVMRNQEQVAFSAARSVIDTLHISPAAMASVSRLGAMARVPLQMPRRGVQFHFLNTSAVLRSEATSNLGTVAGQKKPIGGFRGGFVVLRSPSYCFVT